MPYTQSASTFNMQNLTLANTQQCGLKLTQVCTTMYSCQPLYLLNLFNCMLRQKPNQHTSAFTHLNMVEATC